MTAAVVGLFMTRPPSTAEQEVFPSTDVRLNGLKRLGVADVARQTFQSSKLKLGDSDASAREKTKGAELLRSKHGTRRGLHVSFKVKTAPSSLLNISLRPVSMLFPEYLFRRLKTPASLSLKRSEFLAAMRLTASLAENRGLPEPSSAEIMTARSAPTPVPAMRSKKSAIRA